MCLRLRPRPRASCPEPQLRAAVPPKSEPLTVLLAEDGRELRAEWEVWCRPQQHPLEVDQPPARWMALPWAQQQLVEAAWLEGERVVTFTLQYEEDNSHNIGGEPLGLALGPGSYEIAFGDERRRQHSVRRLSGGKVASCALPAAPVLALQVPLTTSASSVWSAAARTPSCTRRRATGISPPAASAPAPSKRSTPPAEVHGRSRHAPSAAARSARCSESTFRGPLESQGVGRR